MHRCGPRAGDAAYVITYDDPRGAGEANIRVAFVTPQGDLRIAFHRGGVRGATRPTAGRRPASPDGDPGHPGRRHPVVRRATGAGGLPPPSARHRGHAHPARTARATGRRTPTKSPQWSTAARPVARRPARWGGRRRGRGPGRAARFYAAAARRRATRQADEIDPADGATVASTTDASSRRRRSPRSGGRRSGRGEMLVAAGSPPSFAYVPMGPGLVVQPGGGYAPSPLSPWVPVGTTGVIRRAERNAEIVAEREVDVIMIPGERYARDLAAAAAAGGARGAPAGRESARRDDDPDHDRAGRRAAAGRAVRRRPGADARGGRAARDRGRGPGRARP